MSGTDLLAGYLHQQKLSYAAFARLVGADRARIQRCATGERRPGLDLAVAIEQATEGKVPASSWRSSVTSDRVQSRRPSRKARRGRSALHNQDLR